MNTKTVTDQNGIVLGEVVKETRNIQTAPGEYGTETVFVAVPLSRMAHANTDGCPSYRLQRDAVQALRAGTYGPL
jgi:hypothetical protein